MKRKPSNTDPRGATSPGAEPRRLASQFLREASSPISEPALRQLLESYLPSLTPRPGFRREVLRRAREEGVLLAWHQRGLQAPVGLLQRSGQMLRGGTALALVVFGCGVGVLGTLLGTIVTSLGIAGTAVWSSRLALELWTWGSEMLALVFGTADIGRRAWLASSSTTIVLVVALCFVASSLGLIALHRLRQGLPGTDDLDALAADSEGAR